METNFLLLAARKGAVASFETKHWVAVLEALGFKASLEKEGRTVVKAIVTAPSGQILTIVKEAHYRRILWYEIGPWMKQIGFNMVEAASKILGMETPEEEKRLKGLYERDLTNTGTCGVCEGNFKREADGSLHMHGFTRPGDGMLHGRCFGVGYQPHEISVDAARDYLARALRPYLAEWKVALSNLKSGKVDTLSVRKWNYETRQDEWKTITAADGYDFTQAMAAEIYKAENNVRWATQDVERFEKKIAEWKVDVLPEIKYAQKP